MDTTAHDTIREHDLLPFRSAFAHGVDGMVITDSQTRIQHVNKAFTDITGYTEDDVRHLTPRVLRSGRHTPEFYALMWDSLSRHDWWAGEIWNRKKDGTVYLEWLSIRVVRNADGSVRNYLAYFKDITEVKDKERQILFMAYHDTLTGLPNRSMLEDRLAKAVAQSRRNGRKLALFFIDLDDFKRINDTLGHDKGDDLLLEVARRITSVIRTEDTLCRQGGDEFILLAENIHDESTIHHLADRIFSVLREPVEIGAKRIQVNASIGISVFPDDGQSPVELTKSSDMAMYRAKSEGKNTYVMYHADMHRVMQAKLQLESDIRAGLSKAEFFLHFQPKIRCSDQRVSSLEALLRWKHKDRLIPPNAFIPVAEESGLIEELGWLVIDQACSFHHRLRAAGHDIPIAVNLSPRQFHKEHLVEALDRILNRHGVDPMHLQLEVTESTAMSRIDQTLTTMKRMRQRGFRFAIDDFGTGYSSLSYLKLLPVSALKIDKKFVDDLETDDSALVETIVAMGQKLGLTVIAEGVESAKQFDALRAMGCDEVQGYFFSRPLTETNTLEFLAQKRAG